MTVVVPHAPVQGSPVAFPKSLGWALLLEASEQPDAWAEAPSAYTGWAELIHPSGAHLMLQRGGRRTSLAVPEASSTDGLDHLGSVPNTLCTGTPIEMAVAITRGISRKARWLREHQRARLMLALLEDPVFLQPITPPSVDIDPSGRVRLPGPHGACMRLAPATRTALRHIRTSLPVSPFQCCTHNGVHEVLASQVVHLDLGQGAAGLEARRRCARALLDHACDIDLGVMAKLAAGPLKPR